ncbi:MAG: ornithine carbamoyltransferase [Spirochaetales bacterium]|jgi:ornithine carbamoyltransferase|nr:ornithine carbamoyltransferase [Spirochaetales bacterium]
MPVNLRGRSLLTLKDFSVEEIRFLLDLSHELKRKKRAGIRGDLLRGRNVVLIFEKPSTRTRCAFETAVYDEGGHVTFLTNSQMGKKESIEDTARVLGRFYDGIEFRGYKQESVEALDLWAGVPVWNGLTDLYHPTQVLADFMTAEEYLNKPLRHMKLVYVGDGRNNVAASLMLTAAKMGMDFTAVSPRELQPDALLLKEAEAYSADSGATLAVTDDPVSGVSGADIVYTDVWVSMGEGNQFAQRIALLKPYQVTMEMLKQTGNPDVIFEHCLPAFHDLETSTAREVYEKYDLKEMEVTDEVFRSRHSVVFDEAETRVHTIKAVMTATIGNL